MNSVNQRAVTLKDIPFIMNEFELGAKSGNFSKEFLTPQKNKNLEKQLRDMIKLSDSGSFTGHFFYILTNTSDEKRYGFIWLMVARGPNDQSVLEIRAINIKKDQRGKGLATLMLDEWLNAYPHHPFQAKCFAKSSQMIEMLHRRGFKTLNTAASGNKFLFRDANIII
ncbi:MULTISPECIES: N-acetyltransferase [unclassified Kosakonia]|uniref:N-acetyltransferase n=1 Tax=unclassified Kosakonia TaxID=2632876 RepID=UPI0031B68503